MCMRIFTFANSVMRFFSQYFLAPGNVPHKSLGRFLEPENHALGTAEVEPISGRQLCFKPTVVLWRGTTVRNLRKFNVLIFPLLCLFPAPFLLLFNYLKGTYKKICIGVKLSVHRNKCVFRLCLLIAPTHCSFI